MPNRFYWPNGDFTDKEPWWFGFVVGILVLGMLWLLFASAWAHGSGEWS